MYQAPEVEHLNKAVQHLRKIVLPEKSTEPIREDESENDNTVSEPEPEPE